MPVIARVGRRSWGPRFSFGAIYIILTIGGFTMIYPFLVMISTSITSRVDYDQYKIPPAYLYNDDWLFVKYLEERYQVTNPRQNSLALNTYHRTNYTNLKDPLFLVATRVFALPLKDALLPESQGILKGPGDRKATFEEALGEPGRKILDSPIGEIFGTDEPSLLQRRYGSILDTDRLRNAPAGAPGGRFLVRNYLTDAWRKALQKPLGDLPVRQFLDFAKRRHFQDYNIPRLRQTPLNSLLDGDILNFLAAPGVRGQWPGIEQALARTLGDSVQGSWFERHDLLDRPENTRRVEDWEAFLGTIEKERDLWLLAYPDYQAENEIVGRSSRSFQKYLMAWLKKNGHPATLEAYNKVFVEDREDFNRILIPIENPQQRGWKGQGKLYDVFEDYKWNVAPKDARVPISPDAEFSRWLSSEPTYETQLGKLNKAWGASYKSWTEIPLAVKAPEHPEARRLWISYVRKKWNYQYLELSLLQAPFREFAKDKFPGPDGLGKFRDQVRANMPDLDRDWGASFKAWDDVRIPLVENVPSGDFWEIFFQQAPAESIALRTPEGKFRAFLRQKYGGDLKAFNEAWSTAYASFDDVQPPNALWDRKLFNELKGGLRAGYVTHNYREVFSYILLHGRALMNTLILIVGTIGTHLIVNPFAAFALSRYQLAYTNKILLFCLATMAFPYEVALIPNFLFLKETGLLNTFGALILPHMANGYSIFLLKGFFDSLPKELYESAAMEGASEFRMFRQITIPLSKPILAVIALNSFQNAYGSFIWAFVVCPKQEMWTLMVWLYDLNGWAPYSMFVAALCVAALPTLLLFVFAQKIIMRGIVLPLAH